MKLTRREALKGAGALVVSFGMPLTAAAQQGPKGFTAVDAWLAVAADGRVVFHVGKVELGTGVRTALAQLVAEELDVPFERVELVMGDTDVCPDQGSTTGSRSVSHAGPQLRRAAAEARQALIQMAAARWSADPDAVSASDGVLRGPNGRSLPYGELVGGHRFERGIGAAAALKTPGQMKVIGKPIPRVELPGKIFGRHAFVQNLRIPGMLHGRVVRPPLVGATVESVDDSAVRGLPGNPRVVTRANFVGLVAEREEDAIRAANLLKVQWKAGPALPAMTAMPGVLQGAPAQERALAATGNVPEALATAARTQAAEYYVPFQMHGSIGPSCAVADAGADRATVWCASQSPFQTRDCIAALLGIPPDRVHVVWVEGSGCYGHNGADDVSGDAALLAYLVRRPVRVQWMRHDEHCHEPKGVPMVFRMQGGLDPQGHVVAWENRVWSTTHSARPMPGAGGNLLAGHELGMAKASREVGADRNARPSYDFPNSRVTLHFLQSTVLRVSALRGLGSPQNTFANESFMDELAASAQADPLAFRIRHLKDGRAIAVLEAVRELSRWDGRASPKVDRSSGVGRGVAFVQYENDGAYVATAVRVRVRRDSGKVRVEHVAVAHDCGLCVNPDGMRNQIEGNVIQGISRATLEQVTFDSSQVTSVNWASYPILRFSDVPEDIAIALIDRPDQPALGGGEPAIVPMFAAIANAIHDATGARLRTVPFTAERVKAALA